MTIPSTKFASLIVLLTCLSVSVEALAEGIMVERASGRMRDAVYLMDANIRYDLNESVLEAINHGIQLQFDVTVELKRERRWIWHETVKTVILSYQLEYQPLSNNYLITNITTGLREQLPNLDEALKYLGTINDYPLFEQAELDPEYAYKCLIMSELRIRSLPLPLQPLAYISPKWHLTSQWYEWVVR